MIQKRSSSKKTDREPLLARSPASSISRQLAISLGLTVVSVLLVVFLVGSIFSYKYHLNQLNERGNELIRDLAGIFRNPMWNLDFATIKQTGDLAFRNDLVDEIVIVFFDAKRENVIFSKDKSESSSWLNLSQDITFNDKAIGNVKIGVTTNAIRKSLYSFLSYFSVVLFLIFISILLATRFFIKRYLNAPLDQLNTVLYSYSRGNYTIPHSPFTNREFQRVGAVLYHMGETIRQQIEKLSQADRLFNNIKEMIFRMRIPEGYCEYVNPAVEDVLGYSVEAVKSTPDILVKIIHPDFREELSKVWKNILENKLAPSYVYKILDSEGKTRWIHQSNIAIRDDNGKIVAIEGCCTNITEQKIARMEKAKLEAQLRQSQKMEAIGQLAGGIAHDFNNILGMIMGNLTLAKSDITEDHPAFPRLDAIGIASKRAKDVVAQILSFGRKKEFKHKPVKVDTVLNEALVLLRATISRNITIDLYMENQLPFIKGDATQLHQVFINIATNAVHAMEEKGGGTLTIEASRAKNFNSPFSSKDDSETAWLQIYTPPPINNLPDDGYIKVIFTDTGCGIDPAIRENILDPYFTTKAPDKGTGLGLSVVHGIVKNMDGHIIIESAPGKGTRIAIFFPSLSVIHHEDESVFKSPQKEISKPEEVMVLFVDDEEMLQEMCSHALEHFGYKVKSHICPADALKEFRQNPSQFNIMLTDMNMPLLSGEELITEVLAIQPELPVIACSGDSTSFDLDKIKAKGTVTFLEKPYDIYQLSDVIQETLRISIKSKK
ncbi:putative Histidine kinase [Desulfamplus magnetovallimortis]|uniref:histidine kinase n=1 Tax=Desulfamplus magnetovallimortis TaxID=1246637 RepID=A0A1W1HJA1_9BACT|nr:PAS domain-containing sensor histidine kinase [Desulfamplus magnetovallimortis]SLM32540.1 putative Histidine kinase [Desulfamplus magnetovallimortis]